MAFFLGKEKRMHTKCLKDLMDLQQDLDGIDELVLDLKESDQPCAYEQIANVYAHCLVRGISFHMQSMPAQLIKDKKQWNIPEEKRKEQAERAWLELVFPIERSFSTLNDLKQSTFRSSFHLSKKLIAYAREKGVETLIAYSLLMLEQRLFVPFPKNDGKQTPMKGHPVFVAQHATATCCRGCLEKWHHVPKGRKLTAREKQEVLMLQKEWIEKELKRI